MSRTLDAELRSLIRDVPDFPKAGIVFKDITPLLENPAGFRNAITSMAECLAGQRPDALVAIESRGFILGAPLAVQLGLPLVLVRKPNKLPRLTESIAYELEYGTDSLHVHADAIRAGGRYAVVDDVLATGGTAAAVVGLLERLGGVVVCQAFLIELGFLDGRHRLGARPVQSLVTYS